MGNILENTNLIVTKQYDYIVAISKSDLFLL